MAVEEEEENEGLGAVVMVVEPGIGEPISPGTILPLVVEEGMFPSGSYLTSVRPGPSVLMVKYPPPFWPSPSVSHISSISFICTGASLGGRI